MDSDDDFDAFLEAAVERAGPPAAGDTAPVDPPPPPPPAAAAQQQEQDEDDDFADFGAFAAAPPPPPPPSAAPAAPPAASPPVGGSSVPSPVEVVSPPGEQATSCAGTAGDTRADPSAVSTLSPQSPPGQGDVQAAPHRVSIASGSAAAAAAGADGASVGTSPRSLPTDAAVEATGSPRSMPLPPQRDSPQRVHPGSGSGANAPAVAFIIPRNGASGGEGDFGNFGRAPSPRPPQPPKTPSTSYEFSDAAFCTSSPRSMPPAPPVQPQSPPRTTIQPPSTSSRPRVEAVATAIVSFADYGRGSESDRPRSPSTGYEGTNSDAAAGTNVSPRSMPPPPQTSSPTARPSTRATAQQQQEAGFEEFAAPQPSEAAARPKTPSTYVDCSNATAGGASSPRSMPMPPTQVQSPPQPQSPLNQVPPPNDAEGATEKPPVVEKPREAAPRTPLTPSDVAGTAATQVGSPQGSPPPSAASASSAGNAARAPPPAQAGTTAARVRTGSDELASPRSEGGGPPLVMPAVRHASLALSIGASLFSHDDAASFGDLSGVGTAGSPRVTPPTAAPPVCGRSDSPPCELQDEGGEEEQGALMCPIKSGDATFSRARSKSGKAGVDSAAKPPASGKLPPMSPAPPTGCRSSSVAATAGSPPARHSSMATTPTAPSPQQPPQRGVDASPVAADWGRCGAAAQSVASTRGTPVASPLLSRPYNALSPAPQYAAGIQTPEPAAAAAGVADGGGTSVRTASATEACERSEIAASPLVPQEAAAPACPPCAATPPPQLAASALQGSCAPATQGTDTDPDFGDFSTGGGTQQAASADAAAGSADAAAAGQECPSGGDADFGDFGGFSGADVAAEAAQAKGEEDFGDFSAGAEQSADAAQPTQAKPEEEGFGNFEQSADAAAKPAEDEDDFGDFSTAAQITPPTAAPPAATLPATAASGAQGATEGAGGAEDDFGDFNTAGSTGAQQASAPVAAPPEQHGDDGFGDFSAPAPSPPTVSAASAAPPLADEDDFGDFSAPAPSPPTISAPSATPPAAPQDDEDDFGDFSAPVAQPQPQPS
eukprot:Hpha_TRINITY_DN13127_c0_g3::TRINITY_DN13127_c0_g3_i1::g.113865::m.113865